MPAAKPPRAVEGEAPVLCRRALSKVDRAAEEARCVREQRAAPVRHAVRRGGRSKLVSLCTLWSYYAYYYGHIMVILCLLLRSDYASHAYH